MRPESFDDFVGQKNLAGKGAYLREVVESGHAFSLILYGPPGSGKTSLAFLIAKIMGAEFIHLSAVSSSVKDVREVISKAKEFLKEGKRTIVFIDEIHRYNKAQQDVLLPAVEDGTILLIGTTTENPFFEVNAPLLSRCQVVVLNPLDDGEIKEIIERALKDERGLAQEFKLSPEALELIVLNSQGDARVSLNLLESASQRALSRNSKYIEADDVKSVVKARLSYYDKTGDAHYDYISAFIKSMRASDPDAALVYLSKMIEGGEDPKFIARRMVIFASEDIGNADPIALLVAVSCFLAVERVGLPECSLNLSQATTYLATAPKSNASYAALMNAIKDVHNVPYITIPKKLRNAHYPGSEKLGHGVGYSYPHDYTGHFFPESLMPEELKGKKYYRPSDQGFEKKINERLEKWEKLRKRKESN